MTLSVTGEFVYTLIQSIPFARVGRTGPTLWEAGWVLVLLALSGLSLWLAGRTIPLDRGSTSLMRIEPRSALLAPLSCFGNRGEDRRGAYPDLDLLMKDVDRLRERVHIAGGDADRQAFSLDAARSEFWNRVAPTTFGPLFLAIQAHVPKLKEVVLIKTEQTESEFKAVQGALKALWPKVKVSPCPVSDASDVAKIIAELCPLVDDMIRTYMANEVIADFTGGTAAVSAAINLVCLDDEIGLQYTRQGPKLHSGEGEFVARPVSELVAEKVLAEIRTSRQDVPRDIRV